MFYVNKMK